MAAAVGWAVGGPDSARARRALADPAADAAAAQQAATAQLPVAARATAADLRDRLERLRHRVPPEVDRATLFDALASVVPPGGGARAWPASATADPMEAWAGRVFAALPQRLLDAMAARAGEPVVAELPDDLRVWCVAALRLRDLDLAVAAPLGPVDPWIAPLAGSGPLVRAGRDLGVQVWLREPGERDGVQGTAVPLPLADGVVGMAWVVVPSPAERAAYFRQRAAAHGSWWWGLAVVLAALALGRALRLTNWPGAVQRGVGVAVPILARAVLAWLGVPPRLPGVPWLDPAAYAATVLPWGDGIALGPFAAWFATPADLCLTGVAALVAVGVAVRRGEPSETTPVATPAWRALGTFVGGVLGARLAVAALAAVIGTWQAGVHLPLLPDDRFLPVLAEAVLLAAVAAAGLAVALWCGACGDWAWRAAAQRLDPGPAVVAVLGAGAVAFAVPLGAAPWWWRALAFGVATAAVAIRRLPRGPEGLGLSPVLLQLACASALVHAGFERALVGARNVATLAAVAERHETDAWCGAALAAAERVAQDPSVLARCREARQLLPALGAEGRIGLLEANAPLANRLWGRYLRDADSRFGVLEVAAWAPAFDDRQALPIFTSSLNAPRILRAAFERAPVPRRWVEAPAGVELGHEAESGLRIATAHVPVGPPEDPLGVVTLTVPDPWEPETDTVEPWVATPRPAGMAGRPTRVRFREGVARAATDARLQLIPMPAGAAVALRVEGQAAEYVQRIGDTPLAFRALHEPAGGAVRAAGLPAVEAGPIALRFARFALIALVVGALAWAVARRAHWWLDLPPPPAWRRRFKHVLVAAFLALTVPAFLGMALFSQGLLRATLPSGPEAHHRETLELLRAQVHADVRAIDAAVHAEARGLDADKLERHFRDAWATAQTAVLGHDVHLYDARGGLLATSRPDLLRAGVRDRLLPGTVARALLADGQAATFAPLRVGDVTYRVGYRALTTAGGSLVGVIAVPMLAGERAVAARLARTVSLIWTVSLLAVLAVAAIALGLSRRLARPMELLTAATARIAAGDLEARVPATRADELGDLQRAFNRMADDLAASRAALVRAEKEAAWREMAQQIAHEVKNPLTPLKLLAQHLQRAWRDQSPQFGEILSDASQRIIDQVEALRKVASRFSAFAGRPEAVATEVDVNALAADACALYQGADARHRLTTEWAAPPPRVMADRDDLRRVLINLVTNAMQATPAGGTIHVRTVRNKRPAPPGRGTTRRIVAEQVATAPHGWVGIEVRDDGPGIPADVQERLFEPYFSTKTQGTGLGLWICRTTVQEMGGEISLTSVEGTGTSAWVWLPRLPDEAGEPSQETPDAPAAPPDAR